jgi:hypothetical protein
MGNGISGQPQTEEKSPGKWGIEKMNTLSSYLVDLKNGNKGVSLHAARSLTVVQICTDVTSHIDLGTRPLFSRVSDLLI